MPKYRVQLKQGSKTITEHIEAKNLQSVKDFFNLVSTAKVTEILKVEFMDDTLQPIDDMNYYGLAKIMVANKASHKSKQVIFHNIKKTKSSDDLIAACKLYLEIDGLTIDSCYSGLIKS